MIRRNLQDAVRRDLSAPPAVLGKRLDYASFLKKTSDYCDEIGVVRAIPSLASNI